jgi:uncharacterized protein YciI
LRSLSGSAPGSRHRLPLPDPRVHPVLHGVDDDSGAGHVANPNLAVLGIGFVVLAPVVGGLVYGPLVSRFAPEARGHGVPDFDRFTVALLMANPAADRIGDATEARLQDEHMVHIADLYDAGHLLAAGPMSGPAGRKYRGLSILNVDVEHAKRLKASDPAIRAGRYVEECMPWIVPKGAISFARARIPRSMAETGM